MTIFNIASYILINSLLFSSWHIFLFRKRSRLSFVDRLTGSFVLGLAQIIATEMLLGALFKRLYAMPLFLLNFFISISMLVFVSLQNGILKDSYTEVKDEATRFLNLIKADFILLCIFGFFVISILWMIFLGYLFPSYTWDALWYHLPIIGYIMQGGAIQENPTPSLIDLFINIFPKNMELFFLWNTIFLESDIISDLSQLLFAIAGVLAVYSISIKIKIKEEYALYSSLLFFFTPIITLQSTTNYIDVAISSLFLIAVNFLMYDKTANSRTVTLLLGLTTGILFGSKGSGPLFVGVLSFAVIAREAIRRLSIFNVMPSDYKVRGVGFYMKYFLAPAVLMGGYWYVKNWLLYGNPVYPMEVSFLGVKLFKGLFGGIIDPEPNVFNSLSSIGKLIYVWQEKVQYYLYDSRLSGFGPMWFILFLPAIIFFLFYALKNKRHDFLFFGVLLTATFIIHLRNWNTRYVIFIVALGAVSFGFVIDYLGKKGRAINILALLLVVYTFFASISPCITPEKIKEFINLPMKERTIARHAPFNIDLQSRQEYGYWIWISRNIVKGDTLAYTFEPLFLSPLWNNGFTSRIVYIKSENYNKWQKELRKNNVTYALVRVNSAEEKWIGNAGKMAGKFWWFGGVKEKFKVVYSDKNYKIVKVLK
ncbi:MAG: hypothetical protein HY756_12635 [Nitrospirae bacterium]|nr:hypothetical protein [Nitrospirota bacterium]